MVYFDRHLLINVFKLAHSSSLCAVFALRNAFCLVHSKGADKVLPYVLLVSCIVKLFLNEHCLCSWCHQGLGSVVSLEWLKEKLPLCHLLQRKYDVESGSSLEWAI